MSDHYAGGPWPRTMPQPPAFVDIPERRIVTIRDQDASCVNLEDHEIDFFVQVYGDPIMEIPVGLEECHLGILEMLWHPLPGLKWCWQARIHRPATGDVFFTPVVSGNPPPPPPRFEETPVDGGDDVDWHAVHAYDVGDDEDSLSPDWDGERYWRDE